MTLDANGHGMVPKGTDCLMLLDDARPVEVGFYRWDGETYTRTRIEIVDDDHSGLLMFEDDESVAGAKEAGPNHMSWTFRYGIGVDIPAEDHHA